MAQAIRSIYIIRHQIPSDREHSSFKITCALTRFIFGNRFSKLICKKPEKPLSTDKVGYKGVLST